MKCTFEAYWNRLIIANPKFIESNKRFTMSVSSFKAEIEKAYTVGRIDQKIDDVGKDFKAARKANDGVIDAFDKIFQKGGIMDQAFDQTLGEFTTVTKKTSWWHFTF
jgi:hypothetical protein